MPAAAYTACHCGRQHTYEGCCRPLHHGAAAPDAETLMRSRYSAYVLGLEQYLLDTWHPSTRPASLNLAADQPGMKWIGLDVKRHESLGENEATVEFVARYKVGGRAHRMHEVSRFVRQNGQWFYVGPNEPVSE